jgi:choline kinase
MKAIILAAGIASRLRPLTNKTPKCLIKVGNISILERTLTNLLRNNITDFVIVTGFMEELIKGFIETKFPNINVTYITNQKYETTNNIYSLWLTKEYAVNNDIILLDSDIIFDSRIIGLLKISNYDNCLAVKTDIKLGEEEIKVTVNKDNSIKEISKVVNPKDSIGESIGIEKFSSALVDVLFKELDQMIINENLVDIFYEAAFERVINKGEKIYSILVNNLKCIEIDYIEDLEKASKDVIYLQ